MKTSPPLDESSRMYLGNVLNEVLHGLRVDYEKTLGARQEEVLGLFSKLQSARDVPAWVEGISGSGVKLWLKCSNLCLREFDADEFETRLGEAPAAARQVNDSLSASMDVLSVPA